MPGGETAEVPTGRRDALLPSLRRAIGKLTLARGLEAPAAQAISEALAKRRASTGVEDDFVAPAARPAARELDSAALAGLGEGEYGATITH